MSMANRRNARLHQAHADASRPTSPATARSEASNTSGSKASSPVEQPKAQIDFQFLNFSHPSDAKTGKTRKAVRSHVTKQQHQRENAAAAARRAKSYQASPTETDEPPSQRVHAATFPSALPSSHDQPGETVMSPSTTATMSTRTPATLTKTESSETSSPSNSPAPPSPTDAPQRRLDPTEIYPEEWQPYIQRIMEHYFTNIAVDTAEVDDLEDSGLLSTRFSPFILTDPAPLHAVMLVAASHYGKARGPRSHTIDLLQLRGMAIGEINRALESSIRATSDQLITAVAHMAQYESLFGDRGIYNTHMTGLLRMVSLRGGLPALGLDGLLERMLLYIDSNSAHITQSHVYFDKAAFPTSAVHPRPDPARYLGI